jgi:hypothetical protein
MIALVNLYDENQKTHILTLTEDILGETADEDVFAGLFSEAKDHTYKHSLEKTPPCFFEG